MSRRSRAETREAEAPSGFITEVFKTSGPPFSPQQDRQIAAALYRVLAGRQGCRAFVRPTPNAAPTLTGPRSEAPTRFLVSFDRAGPAEQIALRLVQISLREERELAGRLDAFGQHRQAEAAAEAEHGAHDRRRPASLLSTDWMNEPSILILSNGKARRLESDE